MICINDSLFLIYDLLMVILSYLLIDNFTNVAMTIIITVIAFYYLGRNLYFAILCIKQFEKFCYIENILLYCLLTINMVNIKLLQFSQEF